MQAVGKKVVVLDINGIVADIRRREACAVRDRAPDTVLPNGQKVYLHPRAGDFLRWVSGLRNVDVVTYTSRLKHNAEPVEALLDSIASVPSAPPHEFKFRPVVRLYGENCKPAGTDKEDPFHPVKTLEAVVDAVRAERAAQLRPPLHAPHSGAEVHALRQPDAPPHALCPWQNLSGKDVVFVDDHPRRIQSGVARVIEAGRYDASDGARTAEHLLKTAQEIQSLLDHWKN
jgi:hypothetical protein